LQQSGLVHLPARQGSHLLRGVEDGAVAGAAAQVARKVLHRLRARHATALADLGLVQREQAHHEARRAEAALRAVVIDQRLLHRVQGPGGRGSALGADQWVVRQILGCPERLAVDGVRQGDAGVDGTVADATTLGLAHDHGAGAAVAFAAALFGSSVAQVFAQQLQQRAVWGNIGQCDGLATANELQGRQHGPKVTVIGADPPSGIARPARRFAARALAAPGL
jgi:hypothetical protein